METSSLNDINIGLIISQILLVILVIFIFYVDFRIVKYVNLRIKQLESNKKNLRY